jgi:hypothetical protein
LTLVIIGVALAIYSYLYLSTITISVGASLIAAATVSYLSPLNEEIYQKFLSLGISDVYTSRSDVPNSQWVKWLGEAKRNCTLLGIAHGNWRRDPAFPGSLEDRLRNKVYVKLFFLDPGSEAAQVRAREDKTRDTVQTIRNSIKFLWDLRNSLLEREPDLTERLKLYVYNATPSSGMTWIDDFMVVTHYLSGFANVVSPAFLVEPVKPKSAGQSLFGIYAENLRKIEERSSTEINEGNVNQYIN